MCIFAVPLVLCDSELKILWVLDTNKHFFQCFLTFYRPNWTDEQFEVITLGDCNGQFVHQIINLESNQQTMKIIIVR